MFPIEVSIFFRTNEKKRFVFLSMCLFVSSSVIYKKDWRLRVTNIMKEPLEAEPKDFIGEEVSFRLGSCKSIRK